MSQIMVFKFGGASIQNADGFRNVANIIRRFHGQSLVVVVSALGKTTNALENVVNAFYQQNGNAHQELQKVKDSHYQIVDTLFDAIKGRELKDELNDSFVEIEWILDDEPHEDRDYIYDQIVSMGEILSSKILNKLAVEHDIPAVWLDIRDVITTDNTFRDARVQWAATQEKAQKHIRPFVEQGKIIITQGFIGNTTENFTTTLGREGSDYTAAILSYCLDATGMHIWKDVSGVLTGDPRIFEEVTKIPRLSYKEAIEMTYYGAKVIHPKTIKPLQNKNIPLYVRPFDDPSSEGTIISDVEERSYPPIIVIEPNQLLLHISTNDFSFVAEHHLSHIFSLLAECRIQVNMMRNTAISFSVCVTSISERVSKFADMLGDEFKLFMDSDLELITIRHYNLAILKDMKENKVILFEERLQDTVQLVVRNLPKMKRKEY